MKQIDRWLLVRHLKTFAVVLGALCLLYCAIDFADRSQAYTGPHWISWVAKLYGYRALKVAALLSPIANLMAVGLTISAMRRHSEWPALLGAGVSPPRILLPLLVSALAVGGASTLFDDQVAVVAALRAERITAEHFHLWGAYADYFQPKRWVRAGSRIVHFGHPDPSGESADVTVLELTPEFTLARRIDARRARPVGDGRFELTEAKVRSFDGLRQTLSRQQTLEVDLPGAQGLFGLALGKPEMLSTRELRSQIGARAELGLPVGEQRYELSARYADTLAGFAGALLAAALALRGRRQGHLNAALVEGVVIAGLLWAMDAIFKSASLTGRFNPWLCALAPMALAAAVGGAAIWRQVRQPAA